MTRDEILEILESAAKTKKKGGGSGGEEFLKEYKVGDKVWCRNEEDTDGIQDNSKRPFYMMEVMRDAGKEIEAKLVDRKGEKLEWKCEEPKYQGSLMKVGKKTAAGTDGVMDYSGQAATGIVDMIDLDELNHATVVHNLYSRYAKD